MGRIRLGCSGWDYEEWIGPFYPRRGGSKLAAYTKVFDTAEINSTFYRAPTPAMVQGWTRYTPDDFLLAAKVPQTVTHDRLLRVDKGADAELRSFCELMTPLQEAGKLGVFLLQLPPRLGFHPDRTRALFEALPEGFRFAIEFRNESWMVPEALDLLRAFGVAYTVVDEPLLPPEVHLTAPLAYFRWHGHGTDPWYNYRYSREELEPWVPRLVETAKATDVVFGYFNNHFHGYAPENCLEVLEMLGTLTPEQRRALERIRDFREGLLPTSRGKVKATTLEDFFGGRPPGDASRHLARLTTKARLERARGLVAGVSWERAGEGVRARVGPYRIEADLATRTLRHDCEDWRKNLPEGPLCKHVTALLLALPGDDGVDLARELGENRMAWRLAAG